MCRVLLKWDFFFSTSLYWTKLDCLRAWSQIHPSVQYTNIKCNYIPPSLKLLHFLIHGIGRGSCIWHYGSVCREFADEPFYGLIFPFSHFNYAFSWIFFFQRRFCIINKGMEAFLHLYFMEVYFICQVVLLNKRFFGFSLEEKKNYRRELFVVGKVNGAFGGWPDMQRTVYFDSCVWGIQLPSKQSILSKIINLFYYS